MTPAGLLRHDAQRAALTGADADRRYQAATAIDDLVAELRRLIARDATYSGPQIIFTLESHHDAMNAVRRLRNALERITTP